MERETGQATGGETEQSIGREAGQAMQREAGQAMGGGIIFKVKACKHMP